MDATYKRDWRDAHRDWRHLCPCGCGYKVSRDGRYRRYHAPVGPQLERVPMPEDVVSPSDNFRLDENGVLYWWWEARQKRCYGVVHIKECAGCGIRFITRQPRRDLYCTRSCSAKYRPHPSGDKHYRWSGGRYVNSQGYAVIKRKRVQRLEHRLVMEGILGRPLTREENVHHINGDKLDNRPENLELWSTSQPSGQRVADKVAWARDILRLYGDFFDLFDLAA